ncbi:MAG: HesA/MoeB/ThiF family protein [Asgard group archaeon]|nr:HesA/MoeB/ThiF family protein [Asgard group archaeon]
MINKYQDTRYSRFIPLTTIGEEGMDAIRNARAVVVGCGGLGAITATQLAAMGIGYLRIVDFDVVDITNLQRQLLYREADIGKPKVEIAKKFLENLNPDVTIETLNLKVDDSNVSKIAKDIDFIMDASDSFSTRYSLNREALKQDIPYIFGAVGGVSGNCMTIKKTYTCLECVFSGVDDDNLPSNTITGIHPSIINIIGSMQITEATRIMVKKEPLLLDKLFFCDIDSLQFDIVSLKPQKSCICSD